MTAVLYNTVLFFLKIQTLSIIHINVKVNITNNQLLTKMTKSNVFVNILCKTSEIIYDVS